MKTGHLIAAVLAASIAFGLVLPVSAQDSALLPLWPVFSSADDGPNFIVECRNSTTSTIISLEMGIAVRIDGTIPVDDVNGLVGAIAGAGSILSFTPGERWHVLVGLRGAGLGMRVASFGTSVKVSKHVELSPGRHVIEIRCSGLWSDAIAFYWDARGP